MMEQISKLLNFIKQCNIIHNNNYDYTNSVYINSLTKIDFICKKHNNLISMLPGNHKSGRGCKICAKEKMRKIFSSNTEEFIKKAILIHNKKYSYYLVNYINARKKVIIKCHIHGCFEQIPDSHLKGKGCVKCRNKKVGLINSKKIEKFIEQSNIIHNFKYNYDKCIYVNENSKLIITCPIHGDFEQIAANHLKSRGCKKCGNIATSNYQKINPNGWKLEYWENKAKQSKTFDSFKIYLIKCWNDEEKFYKIGRTYTNIFNRFRNKNFLPYNYEIIKEIIGEADYIYKTEHILKNKFKELKYIPNIKFDGMQECFKIDKKITNEFNI
jgi:hypothetical protein